MLVIHKIFTFNNKLRECKNARCIFCGLIITDDKCTHVYAKICDTPHLQKDAQNVYTFATSDQGFETIRIAVYILFKGGQKKRFCKRKFTNINDCYKSLLLTIYIEILLCFMYIIIIPIFNIK